MVDVGLEALSPHALTPIGPMTSSPSRHEAVSHDMALSPMDYDSGTKEAAARINESAATFHRVEEKQVVAVVVVDLVVDDVGVNKIVIAVLLLLLLLLMLFLFWLLL